MRLAIITTVYNHAHFLPECLASVAASDTDCLHVVVDDASPDGARSLIVDYCAADPAHRRAVLLDRNVGLAAAYHAGVAAVPDGIEWLLKTDADDKIDPRYVGAILAAADADPTRNVIFAPCKHFGTRDDVYTYRPFDGARMWEQFYIPGPAAYRRHLWDAVGGYDVTMRYAEDWDFYIRAHCAVGLVPHQLMGFDPPLYWYYRQHDGQRAHHEGLRRISHLRAYWQRHSRETLGTRTWRAWCEERGLAA